jgi:hypothetical protein
MKRTLLIFAIISLALPAYVLAGQGHDENCIACHSIHEAQGKFIMAVSPDTKTNNPWTGTLVKGMESTCLGCHSPAAGIRPVQIHKTHPTGVAPKKTAVPSEYLKDGNLTCTGCHEPHPANANYRYLTIDTKNGKEMGKFCAACHPEKGSKRMGGGK